MKAFFQLVKAHKIFATVGFFVAASLALTMTFQNCAGSQFSSDTKLSDQDKNNLQNCNDPNCQNILNGNGSCTFNGQTINHGDFVTAYQNPSMGVGQPCVSQTRTCNNGHLTGNFPYASCVVSGSGGGSCLFNGVTIADGATVTAYLTSNGAGGACVSETRTCNNGNLSGSYAFAACTSGGASCLFNGQTVADGTGLFAFQNSTVPAGQTCGMEFRLCTNGNLSGSFTFGSCVVNAPASCTFNGQTVPSGTTVTAFQNSSTPVGQACVSEVRSCYNGNLSGTYTYGSCTPGVAASCLFNGQTVAHGGTITGYLNSTVPYGQTCASQIRTCTNGSLSGSYNYISCTVGQGASCLLEGQPVADGQTVTAYQNATVPAGQTCVSQMRTCTNGALSGSYEFRACTPNAPMPCTFNGQSVADGQTIVAYQNSTVQYGQTCVSETRTCNAGQLSGSYAYASCTPNAPLACTFNNMNVASGQTVTAYPTSYVPFGQTCSSETRTCTNGILSGSALYASCVVDLPASCIFNGQTIAHGQNVTAYPVSTVPYGQTCAGVNRTCTNGSLGGSGNYASCTVNQPAACLFNGMTIAHGATVTAYSASSVAYGQDCSSVAKVRTCNNGTLSESSYTSSTCVVRTPKWINTTSPKESYINACARVGMDRFPNNSGINGLGICAATESRPGPDSGLGWQDIVYKNGIKNSHGAIYPQVRGGVKVETSRNNHYCYKLSQKHDYDSTDLVVAYLCVPRP